MKVKIYLRSILHNGEPRLSLFDSKGNGDIDNLLTTVTAGDKIIWKLDSCSGIRKINKISSKNGDRNVFKTDPKKQFLCKGFVLHSSDSIKTEETEAYTIEYVRKKDNSIITLDPYVKITPPPVKLNP